MAFDAFEFVSDHLALDFLNTHTVSHSGAVDRLTSPARLTRWLEEAGIADVDTLARLGTSPPESRLLFDEAIRLRDVLLLIVERFSRSAPVPDGALDRVNRVLETSPATRQVEASDAGYAIVESRFSGGPRSLLAPLADAVATLIVHGEPRRVRQCRHEACGMWFYDVSKNGSRRWCSMARCGNRAKVAARYRRQKTPGPPPA